MEAFRQDVHQEAADELVGRRCYELVPLGTFDPVVEARNLMAQHPSAPDVARGSKPARLKNRYQRHSVEIRGASSFDRRKRWPSANVSH
jgi:hypothetical protein